MTSPFTFTIDGDLDAGPNIELPNDCEPHTATVWTVHIGAGSPALAESAARRILDSNHLALTGDVCGGDSFLAWCEVYEEGQAAAVHVYYRAANPAKALEVAATLCGIVGVTSAFGATVSTGGDWAEQIDGIFEVTK